MLEDGGANGKEKTIETSGTDGNEERFIPETLDGCKLGELGDAEVKIVEGFAGIPFVRGAVRGDAMERTGLKE